MNTEDKMRATMAASEKEAQFLANSYKALNSATKLTLPLYVLIAKRIADNPPKVYHAEFRELIDLLEQIQPMMALLVNFNNRHREDLK